MVAGRVGIDWAKNNGFHTIWEYMCCSMEYSSSFCLSSQQQTPIINPPTKVFIFISVKNVSLSFGLSYWNLKVVCFLQILHLKISLRCVPSLASRSSMFSHGSFPFLSIAGMSRNMQPRRGSRFTVRADAVCVPFFYPLRIAFISDLLRPLISIVDVQF